METNSTQALKLARLESQIGLYMAMRSAIKHNCLQLFLLARALHRNPFDTPLTRREYWEH